MTIAAAAAVTAQDVDAVFDFIPSGGRTLLQEAVDAGLPDQLADAVGTSGSSLDDWQQRLEAARPDSPAIANLDEWQTDTLAYYLASNAPLDLAADLPRDGRDMALQYCQSCHIITVVVTQDRTREAWLGTMHKPSHIEIKMTEPEREALADYLVINAGIPIDQVPPELRAGGASY
ncbi:MAG: cytochrome c [Paracoccaceae bacterium]